jgi:hypothetical protein
VHVLAARGLAGVAVVFERRNDHLDVAGRQRALVLAHDVRLDQVRIGREQR